MSDWETGDNRATDDNRATGDDHALRADGAVADQRAGDTRATGEPILSVRGLEKHYPITQGVLKREVGRVRAVDGISFDVRPGETLGLVGESGCGKSTAATSMLRLEEPTGGEIRFDGENIAEYDDKQLKAFRRRAQMIFQDPTSSFDPRMSIGQSIAEPLVIHGMADRERRRAIVKDLLERVGMAAGDIDRYPHEFSGGQKQRVALARAMVVNPSLIVADEPTSALDVSIQAEILSLLDELQDRFDLGVVFISHDMGVIREICDRVAVMYLGEIVELAPTHELFENPQHPYTEALLASIPQPDPRQRGLDTTLSGDVPSPANPPSGCRFHTRCPKVIPPEEFDLEQQEYRAVLDLKLHVERRDIDTEAVRAFVAESAGSPETVSEDAAAAEIREEFGVPETVSDPEVESLVADAISQVLADEFAAASETLEALSTVCEHEHPDFRDTAAGHPAACHLVGE